MTTLYERVTEFLNISASDPRNDAHKQRARSFSIAWDYFLGKHKKPFKIINPNSPDLNVTENYYRSIIQKGVYFAVGSGVTIMSDNEAVRALWDEDEERAFKPDAVTKRTVPEWRRMRHLFC